MGCRANRCGFGRPTPASRRRSESTPAFLLNDYFFVGAVLLDRLRVVVDRGLSDSGRLRSPARRKSVAPIRTVCGDSAEKLIETFCSPQVVVYP